MSDKVSKIFLAGRIANGGSFSFATSLSSLVEQLVSFSPSKGVFFLLSSAESLKMALVLCMATLTRGGSLGKNLQWLLLCGFKCPLQQSGNKAD